MYRPDFALTTPRSKLGVGDQALQVVGQGLEITGFELKPVLALTQKLLVHREPSRDRDDPGRQSVHQGVRGRVQPL